MVQGCRLLLRRCNGNLSRKEELMCLPPHRHCHSTVLRLTLLYISHHLSISKTFLNNYHVMFRKQLMRASRTASQKFNTTSSIQQRQIISSSYSSWSSQLLKSQTPRASQHLIRRWQSTEAAKSESASAETAKPAEASSEDALKQEIEKQKKEIIDLKVCDGNKHMVTCRC